jgi:PAS domain S-box-containing protein
MTVEQETPRRGEDPKHARRCEALIENSFDVITIIDPDGSIKYSSPSTSFVLGWSATEITGQHFQEFIHPDDRDLYVGELARLANERDRFIPMEIRAKHRSGEWRIVQLVAQDLREDSDIGGVVMNFRDVTDQRRAEERYRTSFRACPDSITISFLDDGRFVEVNDGFEILTGYERSEIIGRSSLDLNLWEDPEARERLTEILDTDKSARNFEADFRLQNGKVRHCLVSAEIIHLEDRPCVLMVVKDITAIRRRDRHLRETTERLRQEHEEVKRKNTALSEVLKHLEHDKAAFRHEVSASLENLIRPLIERLEGGTQALTPDDIDQVRTGLMRILGEEIDEFQNNLARLTPRELDISEMIKNGLSSKEIAANLGLSAETVHKHRQSIRKKLQIDRSGVSLASYLRTRM